LAQALDNLILFAWLHWTKAALVVDEHDLAPLHHDHHIGQVVAVQINEAQRDGRLVAARPKELWSQVDTSMGSIATRPFDHLDSPAQVDRQKMAWRTGRIIMTRDGIDLTGVRISIP